MSRRSKDEITMALSQLGDELVDKIFESVPIPGITDTLIPRNSKFIAVIVYCSMKRFFAIMTTELKQRAARSMGVAPSTDDSTLVQIAAGKDIDPFVECADLSLLREYARLLKLPDENDRAKLVNCISDELMLTGTESVLLYIRPAVLREMAAKLGVRVDDNASSKTLADSLMMNFFQLVPNPVRPKPARKSTPRKKPEPVYRSQPRNSRAYAQEEESSSDADVFDESEESEESDGKTKREPAAKKRKFEVPEDGIPRGYYDSTGKWVAPPFENIIKGLYNYQLMFDNYNLTDLVRFCQEHDLCIPQKRKKPVIIKAILEWVDTGHYPIEKKGRKSKGKGKGRRKSAVSKSERPEEGDIDDEEEEEDATGESDEEPADVIQEPKPEPEPQPEPVVKAEVVDEMIDSELDIEPVPMSMSMPEPEPEPVKAEIEAPNEPQPVATPPVVANGSDTEPENSPKPQE